VRIQITISVGISSSHTIIYKKVNSI